MNKKEKIMIFGGGYAEIPLIKVAKDYGYYVITTGNQPEGLGHALGDEFIFGDFSDKKLMLDIAKEQRVSAVCSGCNDFALISTAYVAEELRLKGHDSYEVSLILHHKDRYREFAQLNAIPTPKMMKCFNDNEVEGIVEQLQFPVMVKPVDLTGGKGIYKCETIEEVKKAFYRAITLTRMNYVIIEEFVMGSNHGFSALLQDKKIRFFFVDNEQYYLNKYMVGGASTPTSVPYKSINQLIQYCEIMAEKLQLVDGILHIQFILDQQGEPIIIEVCRRAPGDLYIKLVELSTNFNYSEAIVACEANLPRKQYEFINPRDYLIRYCVMSEKEGVFKRIKYSSAVKPYIVEQMVWGKEGDLIENKLTYKAGIVFLRCKTRQEQEELLKDLDKKIYVEVL